MPTGFSGFWNRAILLITGKFQNSNYYLDNNCFFAVYVMSMSIYAYMYVYIY